MQCPSAERLPDAEEVQPEFYEKDKGSAGIHGQLFEYKFCALLFLRATNKGHKFKLASNAKGFGAFDDVVVEYLDATSRKSHIFLQLKSKKEPKHITMKELLAEKGNFSLRKYYESYIQIEEKFNSSEEGVKIDGRIDESLFIIYTNADVGKELKCNKATEVGEEEFLMTGGCVLQFNEEEHKDIYEHLQELPKHREFLSRFRIFYSQAGEKKMECHIKRELQQSMQLPDTELELAYMFFLDFIKDWWQNSNFFLKETNCMENDPLQKTLEKVRTTLVAKILDQRKYELDELNIKYKESAIRDMKQLIQPHKAVLIFAPGRSTTLTAAKIHQMLSGTTHIILNLQQLVRYKSGVMSAWKHKFKVMVMESESCDEDFQDAFSGMSVILNECDVEQKFIFISSRKGNIQQISALRSTFSTNLTEKYDDWKFADIDTESRKFVLQKKVYFQGAEVKLSDIVKEYDVEMLNALDCDSMSRLLGNEIPSIGIPIENTVEYYIDRTLQCRRDMKPRFPIQGQIQYALNGDIFQESQDIRPRREENLKKRDTPKGWEPRTLLDGGDRIILVVDEPGMGKSTLLSHLAKKTRKSHPETWIVRVNLNNYTRTLDEMKRNGSGEEGATKLLTKAAQIKENYSVMLAGELFHYSYNSTGNMAVLIDGVDEVSPHYTKEVTQILKILYKTKIKNIWVTSRNSVKGHLEHELQCQSYSLVPFSEEDQKRFLVKFWSKECVAVPRDHLENLANRVVELSIKHLRDGEKNFMGLPLQSMLLAEMFEENLKHCSTSVTVELPEYINLVMLYDLYVKKKWNIYLSDKKISENTNVIVLTENAVLHEHFIHNHMAAALVAILSPNQFEELTDITTLEKARLFIQKIDEGVEKTGIITNVIEGRPVFQHRTLAEYFVARWLCANIRATQTFMRDHIFESGFGAVRNMLDRILADKCPLHEAVLNSNVSYVERLLRKKESISDKDHEGRTPLHIAVSCRRPELITILLEHGADISCVDTLLGLSPVDYANRMDDWEMLSLMMEKRPDIRELVLNRAKYDTMDHIVFALCFAAKYGHNDLLKYLISKGNSVKGNNIAHFAVANENYDILKLLSKHNANLDVKNSDGDTPLLQAVREGRNRIVQYLVDENLDINTQGNDGMRPLDVALLKSNMDITRLLLERNARSCNAGMHIIKAARFGFLDLLQSFVATGEDINVKTEDGESPLHVACKSGQVATVRYLSEHGALLDLLDNRGNTALHVAVKAANSECHLKVVRELLNHSASVDVADEDGCTPLYSAALNGNVVIVRDLLNHGASFDISNKNGWTPLKAAASKFHIMVVREMLKYGPVMQCPSAERLQQLDLPFGLILMLVSLLLASFALIFCLWLVVLQGRLAILCPEECRCDTRGLHVECHYSSLSNIPLIIPTVTHDLLLSNNNITSLENYSFVSRGLTELYSLTILLCELETIELGAFNGITQLTILKLPHNRISVIIPRTFEKMSRLEHLDLAYNRLEHLEVDVFSGLINLKYIDLQDNKLQYLHPDMFIGLHKLEYLNLVHNPGLQVPPDRPFINSHSLSLLYISDCNVRSVSVKTFANVSALELLDLSYNSLRSVDINILKVLPNLSILPLYGNRLLCDCQLQEVWRWCQNHNIQTAYGESAPECDTPSEVNGIWWEVLEKGQCLQGNISYYGDYENTIYRYNPAEDTDNEMDFVFHKVIPLVYAVLFIFVTTGNAILLIIIICNKDMRTVPNMCILNLAISDIIYLILHFAESSANTIPDTWLKGEIKCTFFPFYRRLSVGLSAYSAALLSIQRYRETVYPFDDRLYSQPTWRATATTICGVWIVAALFALPSALSKEFCNFLYNYGSVTYYHLVVLFELLVSCVLPLCVIAFSYIMIARHLLKSAQPISEETQNSQINTRINSAAIVLGLTLVFLISNVPYHVLWSYVIFNRFSFSDEYFVDNLQYIYLVSTYLLLLNPCLNPLALFCTSRAFRRQLKRHLTCFCKANPTASIISNIELTRMN